MWPASLQRILQASTLAPLLNLPCLYLPYGPPLPLGQQLRGPLQPEVRRAPRHAPLGWLMASMWGRGDRDRVPDGPDNAWCSWHRRYFILFLIYVMIGESYGLVLFLARAIWCTSYPDEGSCGGKGRSSESALSQFAVVACVVSAARPR